MTIDPCLSTRSISSADEQTDPTGVTTPVTADAAAPAPVPPAPSRSGLGWVMDVPCDVEFILGSTTVKVRDCVRFAPNSIVRLRQSAGADLEVRVGGVPVAAGEVVIVDEVVSLRLSKILPPIGADLV